MFSSEERESWIRAKYELRAFVAPLEPTLSNHLPEDGMPEWLLSAVTERDLPRLLLLLAHSNKEQINFQPAGLPAVPRTALHAACQLGDVVMTQLLVWVGFFYFYCFINYKRAGPQVKGVSVYSKCRWVKFLAVSVRYCS